jgi:hypothetical protein
LGHPRASLLADRSSMRFHDVTAQPPVVGHPGRGFRRLAEDAVRAADR